MHSEERSLVAEKLRKGGKVLTGHPGLVDGNCESNAVSYVSGQIHQISSHLCRCPVGMDLVHRLNNNMRGL